MRTRFWRAFAVHSIRRCPHMRVATGRRSRPWCHLGCWQRCSSMRSGCRWGALGVAGRCCVQQHAQCAVDGLQAGLCSGWGALLCALHAALLPVAASTMGQPWARVHRHVCAGSGQPAGGHACGSTPHP